MHVEWPCLWREVQYLEALFQVGPLMDVVATKCSLSLSRRHHACTVAVPPQGSAVS